MVVIHFVTPLNPILSTSPLISFGGSFFTLREKPKWEHEWEGEGEIERERDREKERKTDREREKERER